MSLNSHENLLAAPSPSYRDKFVGLLMRAKSRARRSPLLYLPFVRYQRRFSDGEYRRISRDTELLIDAFPRSANTFAAYAFRSAQKRPVKIAHHFHAGAAIVAAARRRIPIMIILRHPRDAIASYLLYLAHNDIAQGLRDYLNYYEVVSRWRSHLLLVHFDSVRSNFGDAIDALNKRFQTSFDLFVHTEDSAQQVFDAIRQLEQRFGKIEHRALADNWHKSTRPNAERESQKLELIEAIEGQRHRNLYDRVVQLYASLARDADL